MKKLFRPLFTFDHWFLEKCQSFSDKITLTFGIGSANYKIAYIFLSLFVSLHSLITLSKEKVEFMNFIIVLVLLTIGIAYLRILKNEERRDTRLSESMARKNPSNFSFIHARVGAIILIPLLNTIKIYLSIRFYEDVIYQITRDLIGFVGDMFFLLFLYFAASSKLPPRKGKLKKKIEGLQASQIPAKAATK